MNWLSSILSLVFVLVAAGLLMVFSLPAARRSKRAFRPILAMQKLRRSLGLAVEDGSRLHVSLGKASIFSPSNSSALIALATLERIAQMSSVSDRPPVATSGDGTLSVLSQDTMRAAYRISNSPELFDVERGRLAGPTPMSYIAGTLPIIRDERISTNILVGNFGPEVALLAEASDQKNAFTLGASDALAAQAALYATSEETLIGEELYALPAYLQAGPAHQASLRVQDILRWAVVGLILLAVIFSFLGFAL